jgi:TP901 family phage tail tape measure protein
MDFSVAVVIQLIDNFSRQLTALRDGVSNFNNELNQTQSKLKTFGETLKQAFDPGAIWSASEKLEDFTLKVAQATALPLATLYKTLDAYKSLELAQAEMEVALMTKEGLPTEKIKELNEQVEELGTKLPGTTADFYRVVTALKGASMDLDKIVNGGLKAASYLWVLFKEEASPKDVAEMVQRFSNAFRIAGEDFEAFADQIQRLKFASGLTLTQLADTTKYLTAEINQLGFTGLRASKFMLAWIGTLKQFGVAGETAGTSIRSVLQRISELDKHFEKLRKQGLDLKINLKDFYDEKGAFKLEEFLMAVRKELSAIQDPLKKLQAIKELFDSEGMRAIAPLLAATKEEALMYLEEIRKSIEATHDPKKIAEFREQYEKLKKQIETGGFSGLEKMVRELDNQASLQQRLNRLMNTYANVLEAVEGTLVNLLSVIGSLVAPTLITILNLLNNLLGKLADFIQENKTVARVLTLAVGGFVSLLAIMGTVSLTVASFMKLFSLAFAPVKWLMTISLIKKLVLALRGFSVALLTSPIGWIALAVGALIGAVYLLWKHWDTVSRWLAGARNWLKSSWQKVLEVLANIQPFFAPIGVLISAVHLLWKHWDTVSKWLSNTWSWLKSSWQKVLEVLLNINPVVGVLIGAIRLLWKHWDTVSRWLAGAWNWLRSSWQKVLEVLININPFFILFNTLNKLVKFVLGIDLFTAGKKIVDSLWKGLANIQPFSVLFNTLNKLVKFVLGIDLFTAGKKIVESLWKGIESLAMKPIEAMKNIVQKIRNLLPFSPAKEGPLKDIHRIKLIETIAAGLNPDPLFSRMRDIVMRVPQFAPPVGLRPALAGATITVNIGPIQVHGTEGSKVAQSVASDLEREIRRVLAKIENERYRRSY